MKNRHFQRLAAMRGRRPGRQRELPMPQTPRERLEHWVGMMGVAARKLDREAFDRAFSAWCRVMREVELLDNEIAWFDEIVVQQQRRDLMTRICSAASALTADYLGQEHYDRCWKPTRLGVWWW